MTRERKGQAGEAVDEAVRARTAGRPRTAAVSGRQIAAAVADLITESGLHGWSLRDLARRLGVSTGTITYYFPDKQTLLVEALDAYYFLPDDREEFRAHTPAAQLLDMVDFFVLDTDRRRRGWTFWLEYMAGAGHDPLLRARHDARYARQRRFFARLFAAGIAAGELVPGLDAEREAAQFIALANGLVLQQLVTPDLLPPATARTMLEAHIARRRQAVDSAPDAG